MQLRINFKKPGAGMYSMFLGEGEKLQFYRGRARRIPPDPDNVFNSIPAKLITSVEIVEPPKKEQWLFENPKALASVQRGLKDAGKGKTKPHKGAKNG